MKKNELMNKVEPFIFSKLTNSNYDIERLKASDLLTWNRLDLAFKLFYLEVKEKNIELAKKVYRDDIKSQTLGKFVEYGNEENKANFDDYINKFDILYNDIKNRGFDIDTSIVPLSKNKSLVNGAHRTAASIYLDRDVDCIFTEQNTMVADYNYFFKRDVSVNTLDLVVNKFIEYSNENTYIAFLWPSGKGDNKKAESFFKNIVYKREISLNANGAFNLLVELYKHMDWSGSLEKGFSGIKKKLLECFPTFEPFTVIVFQSKTIEEVRVIKEKVRQVHKIDFSSIHITDTKEEASRISKLIFNENGIHFLNNSKPYRFGHLLKDLSKLNSYLIKNNCDKNDVILDGSIVLSQYGLRKNADIDYLALVKLDIDDTNYEANEAKLKFHKIPKEDLIYDPKYFFQFNGFKFLSFQQTYLMKKNRGEDRDKIDCNLMSSLIEKNRFRSFLLAKKQTLFYIKIKYNHKFNVFKFFILRAMSTTVLYKLIRFIYRKMKK